MAKNSKISNFLFGHVNIKKWVDFKSLNDNSKMIRHIFENTYSPSRLNDETSKTQNLDFETYIQENNLSQQDLNIIQNKNKAFCQFFGILSLIAIGHLIYTLVKGAANPNFIATLIVSITITFLALSYTWREHFIYCKVKYKNLSLTPRMWLTLLFKKTNT